MEPRITKQGQDITIEPNSDEAKVTVQKWVRGPDGDLYDAGFGSEFETSIVPNVDRDGRTGEVTIYLHERDNVLYDIVLSAQTVDALINLWHESMSDPVTAPPRLTAQELVNLGIALGSFSVGQIDQGQHAVMCTVNTETGEVNNPNLRSLEQHFDRIQHHLYRPNQIGMAYIQAVRDWAKEQGIKYITL